MEALSKDKLTDRTTPNGDPNEIIRGREHDPISLGIITAEEVTRAVEL